VSIDGIFRVYVVIVVGRKLSLCIIYVVTNWWSICPGWGLRFDEPKGEVLENSFDDFLVFNKADDPYSSLTFGTC
jgi:hypothetical protein